MEDPDRYSQLEGFLNERNRGTSKLCQPEIEMIISVGHAEFEEP